MEFQVFIHTNNKQMLGALLSKYSIIKNSNKITSENIKIINIDDNEFINANNDYEIIRNNKTYKWNKNDLQSFTLLRFFPPKIMNYSGFSLVIDPDVFAVSNIDHFLDLNLSNFDLAACKNITNDSLYSSVIFYNNEKVKKYELDYLATKVLEKKYDYTSLMNLNFIQFDNILFLDHKWNSFDQINNDTIFLHLTNRVTQPWKAGLKIDFHQEFPNFKFKIIPYRLFQNFKEFIYNKKFPPYKYYLNHPENKINKYFFNLMRSAIKDEIISEEFIKEQILNKYVRSDILEIL